MSGQITYYREIQYQPLRIIAIAGRDHTFGFRCGFVCIKQRGSDCIQLFVRLVFPWLLSAPNTTFNHPPCPHPHRLHRSPSYFYDTISVGYVGLAVAYSLTVTRALMQLSYYQVWHIALKKKMILFSRPYRRQTSPKPKSNHGPDPNPSRDP